VGTELRYLETALTSGNLSGSGGHGRRCQAWLERELGAHKAFLTPSCTAALELAALLLDIGPGDEVIMPSYTFVSTANAFVLRGARIVFVDVRPDTMNLDETLVESAITNRTKAIVPVHYAGVACDMDAIMTIAEEHHLWVVEDAAQAILSTHHGRALGTIGHLGCLSFHETKSVTAGGEGGAILVNSPEFAERTEILREKGTDRSRFWRGEVAKYTWQDVGSSYLLSDLQAAYLLAQLEAADEIDRRRHELWNEYENALRPLAAAGWFELPTVPPQTRHNAHMFALMLRDGAERAAFLDGLKGAGVMATFHYVPLHSSPAGRRFGRFHGTDRHTTSRSERLVRLPIFFNMTDAEHRTVIDAVVNHCDERSRDRP
jgi:dTDP-4-amino-4,6-dideoxygalactose transaminase